MPLGSDASKVFRNYGFRWTEGRVDWYIDGVLVDSAYDDGSTRVPRASESLHKIMMNAWPVDATASGWAGVFQYPGKPLQAQYEWVRYDSATNCGFTSPSEVARLTYTNP